jgi:hypothetical protein
MYKDKEVKKNVKNILLSMCDVKVFLTFTFTEYGTVLTTILPIRFCRDGNIEYPSMVRLRSRIDLDTNTTTV